MYVHSRQGTVCISLSDRMHIIYILGVLELGTVLVLYVCTVIFFTPLPLDCVYIQVVYTVSTDTVVWLHYILQRLIWLSDRVIISVS